MVTILLLQRGTAKSESDIETRAKRREERRREEQSFVAVAVVVCVVVCRVRSAAAHIKFA